MEARKKFKGFKSVNVPLYTVITPQTGDTYNIRSLKTCEVNALKKSLTTSSKIPEVLNSVIWQVIVHKPSHIDSFRTFLERTTIKDRNAILLGLYQWTFGDNKEFASVCQGCGSINNLKIKLSDIFNINYYPSEKIKNSFRASEAASFKSGSYNPSEVPKITSESIFTMLKNNPKLEVPPVGMPVEMARQEQRFEEYFKILDAEQNPDSLFIVNREIDDDIEPVSNESIFDKRVKLHLPMGVDVYIKQPTIMEEQILDDQLALTTSEIIDVVNDSLVIEKFVEIDPDTKVPIEIKDRFDIIDAFESHIEIEDRNHILKKYYEEFGQYEITLETIWKCSSCSTENDFQIDPMTQFFRLIREFR